MGKEPKKITRDRLKNIALYYLERYPSSIGNLRIVLHRRIFKSSQFHDFNIEEAHEWVEEHIDRFQKIGYLNDLSYAENKIRNLFKKGKSICFINGYLISKMVDKNIINQALEKIQNDLNEDFDDDEVSIDLKSAKIYARKRGLGFHRLTTPTKERLAKDIMSLVRAGFSYSIAKSVIEEDL